MSTLFSTRFIRWSGLALMAAGLLTAIGAVVHPDEVAHPEAINGALWLLVHSGMMLATILMLLGFTALYAKQAAQSGRWGAIGYSLSMVGTALFVGFFYFENLVMPALGAAPVLLNDIFNGPLGLMLLVTGIIFGLGTLLLGINTWRSASLPRWAGLLLMVGGPLTGFSGILPHWLSMAGIILLGVSLIWLGLAMWNEEPQRVAALQQAMA
jgi:hypothetical protein